MSDLRTELLAVREQYGALTARNVLDAARAEDHALHDRFEWDDGVAAERYRLDQARQLIRVVREKYIDGDGRPADVRLFHAVPRVTGMVYEPADEIAADDVARKVLLTSMEREWRQLRARYERFAEFLQMVERDIS